VPALFAAAVVVAADQATKAIVRSSIDAGTERIQLLPGIDLRHVHNTGVAFGVGSDRAALVGIGVAVVGVLLMYLLFRMAPGDRWSSIGIGMIAGGAIGNNAFDRVRLGHVTDFIHLPMWPTFNVADIGITFGVIIVVIRQWQMAQKAAPSAD
jgi:signal peptidase II